MLSGWCSTWSCLLVLQLELSGWCSSWSCMVLVLQLKLSCWCSSLSCLVGAQPEAVLMMLQSMLPGWCSSWSCLVGAQAEAVCWCSSWISGWCPSWISGWCYSWSFLLGDPAEAVWLVLQLKLSGCYSSWSCLLGALQNNLLMVFLWRLLAGQDWTQDVLYRKLQETAAPPAHLSSS